jgi:DNA transformation protein
MSKQNDFVTFLLEDALADIPDITARAMFGGYGIYKNQVIFAIVVDDELYMKVGDNNRADYEKRGSHPFVYTAKGKEMSMSYWQLPPEILEESEIMSEWIEKSLAAHKKK